MSLRVLRPPAVRSLYNQWGSMLFKLSLCALLLITSCMPQPTSKPAEDLDGDGDGGGNNSSTIEPDVSLVEGSWRQDFCSAAGPGTSVNNIVIADQTGIDTINQNADMFFYNASSCPTGTGYPMGAVSSIGNIKFDVMMVDGQGRYFKGLWRPTPATSTRVVWALPTPNRLCIFTDTSPTSFATAASIRSYMNVLLPQKTCYTKL